ncbi:thioredoxin family protein [Desulfohalobium retbaense]|uniref:Redox-active disulfide protein 2 n=1 Tax=Desulfohalobium retbaense (strain ATCC 49708 / DSM 5692 / JCM 16813 / HR100) TaxID=485915 RepID=C8X3R9_DESRD|nr:thioredoxin family protein [Desulfohalobium retbaense]ACV69066.1 redox-active disulfide protein 2 [Desulfohalobium retbaense DSM 5692]
MRIQVLGPGCPNCEKTEQIVREALQEAGVEATVEKVSDFQEIAQMGVLSTPAVVVDGQIKVTGKVPKKQDVLGWIGAAP